MMSPRWLLLTLRMWWQSRTRGWSDEELWSLDHSIAEFLAPRLRRLAEITHGSPSGYPNKYYSRDAETDHESWRRDLAAAAEAFAEYVDCAQATDGWSMEREEAAYREAKRAMDWIAEWFGSLWD